MHISGSDVESSGSFRDERREVIMYFQVLA